MAHSRHHTFVHQNFFEVLSQKSEYSCRHFNFSCRTAVVCLVFHLFSFSALSALNMTERDSITANLASPQDLRMASEHEMDVPMTLMTNPTFPKPAVSRYQSRCRSPLALPHQISRHLPLSNQLSGARKLSIPTPTPSRSMKIWQWACRLGGGRS